MRAFTIALPMCTRWTTRRLQRVLQQCAVWLVMMETILTRGHLVPSLLPPRRPNRLNRKCCSSVWDPLESVNSICYPGASPALPPRSAITRFITLPIRTGLDQEAPCAAFFRTNFRPETSFLHGIWVHACLHNGLRPSK